MGRALGRPRSDSPSHRRSIVALGLVAVVAGALAVPPGAAWLSETAAGWSEGQALLVVVDDSDLGDGPQADLRSEERRADAILVVRWWPDCDRLEVVSIPRGVRVDGPEPLAVAFGTGGPRAVESALERAFGLDVFATVTLDVADVADLTRDVGPLSIELPLPARDRRSGFVAGPGTVVLDASTSIAFLRSRQWEELRDGAWQPADDGEWGRIERQQAYLVSLLQAIGELPARERLWLLARTTLRSDLAIDRLRPVVGLLAGIGGEHALAAATLPVEPTSRDSDRRSPFAPDRLGALEHVVPRPDAGSVFERNPCTGTEAAG